MKLQAQGELEAAKLLYEEALQLRKVDDSLQLQYNMILFYFSYIYIYYD
jgi:hypothetical protein